MDNFLNGIKRWYKRQYLKEWEKQKHLYIYTKMVN
jgi:hypothetical protein